MNRSKILQFIVFFAVAFRASAEERVSTDAAGVQGNGESDNGRLSQNGRFVAFESSATNLAGGDTNGFEDIFRKDRETGTIVRASVPSGGGEPNANCFSARISADGQFVFFRSAATNLVPGDINGVEDIFRRDIVNGTTIRVSTPDGGGEGNGASSNFNISPDGRFVVFRSSATNLVPGDTNGVADIFLKDLDDDSTVRVSTASGGAQANAESFGCSVSDDGNFVAFDSIANNLVAGDTNGVNDIFRKSISTGDIVRVNTGLSGEQANGHSQSQVLSSDGLFVAFESESTNLVPGDTNGERDIFVKEVATGFITRVSVSSTGNQGNEDSFDASFGDGSRLVAFYSASTNLVPGDTNGFVDCFVKNLETGVLIRVSTSLAEGQSNGSLFDPHFSSDGNFVVYDGFASNLVAGDTNALRDVFVKAVRFLHQPDATIGVKPGRQQGDGVYNGSGSGQIAKISGLSRKNSIFFSTLQIDGNVSVPVTLRASRKNRKLTPVYTMLSPQSGNVTAAITGGGLTLADLAPGGSTAATFKVIVKTNPSFRARAVRGVFRIVSSSTQNGFAQDAVKATIAKKP